MITSIVFDGRIRLKRMLKPWAKASAFPFFMCCLMWVS
jgi:hypothetical protein